VSAKARHGAFYSATGSPTEEWQTCGLLAVSSGIGPALKAEVRCRWDAGTPVGLMSEFVEDKPWGVLTAAPCKTASDHHARVGWDAGVTGCRAGVETARGEQAAAMYFACTSGTPFRIPPVKQVGDR